MSTATNAIINSAPQRPPFDPVRFDRFRLAYRNALRDQVRREGPEYPERMRSDPAYCDVVADRLTDAILKGRTCMTVVYLQSKAFRAASKALGVHFTIKAMDAWLREKDS